MLECHNRIFNNVDHKNFGVIWYICKYTYVYLVMSIVINKVIIDVTKGSMRKYVPMF